MHGLRRACTSFNRPALLSLFTSCDRMLTTRHVKLNVHPFHLQYDVYDPIAVSSTRSATPSYTVNKRTHITYIQITIDWPHFKTLSYKRESIQSRAPHMLQVYVYIGWLRYANNNARLTRSISAANEDQGHQISCFYSHQKRMVLRHIIIIYYSADFRLERKYRRRDKSLTKRTN